METLFQRDIKEDIAKTLSVNRVKIDPKEDFTHYVLAYFTLCKKLIAERPRKVFLSKEIKAQLHYHPKASQLKALIERIEQGKPVNAYLSKTTNQTRFHDFLLYEWDIHHLHLETKNAADDRFPAGTKNALLFVYMTSDSAYLLDLSGHEENIFAEKKWLEILYDNWPELMNQWLIEDATGVSIDPNAAERQFHREKLRINGGVIKIGDKVFVCPGLGMATSGHSSEAADRTVGLIGWLKRLETTKDAALHTFAIQNDLPFDKVKLRMRLTNSGIELFEEFTGKLIYTYN